MVVPIVNATDSEVVLPGRVTLGTITRATVNSASCNHVRFQEEGGLYSFNDVTPEAFSEEEMAQLKIGSDLDAAQSAQLRKHLRF